MLFQNWRTVVPEGSYLFGLAVSVALCFMFIRSARLVDKPPLRRDMMRRFEGNILCYIVFAWIFTANQWADFNFHVAFIFAVIGSLLGMTLSLHHDEEGEGLAQIRKVGQAGWFSGVITALFIVIALLCLLLLIPQVNRALYTLAIGAWEGLKWLGTQFLELINRLLSLLPETEGEMEALPMPPGMTLENIPPSEETIFSIPLLWMVGGIALLAVTVVSWILIRMLRNRRLKRSLRVEHITVIKEPWWKNVLKKWKSLLLRIKRKWRMRFAKYYYFPVYWYYYQLKRWGRKNGLPQLKTETSLEYVYKIISHLPEEQKTFTIDHKEVQLSKWLLKLNQEYQATYYGHVNSKRDPSREEYKQLLKLLKQVRIKR
jgi:hypothetical protein